MRSKSLSVHSFDSKTGQNADECLPLKVGSPFHPRLPTGLRQRKGLNEFDFLHLCQNKIV